MAKLRKSLIKKLETIRGLEDRPSKVSGGSAIFFQEKEIAHFHHDNEIFHDSQDVDEVVRLFRLALKQY